MIRRSVKSKRNFSKLLKPTTDYKRKFSRKEMREHEIFKFEELDGRAKERAREWVQETRDPFIFEEMVKEDLHVRFGVKLKVQFSLGSSQGDGLNLYGTLDIDDVLSLVGEGLSAKQKSLVKDIARDLALQYYDLEQNYRYGYSLIDESCEEMESNFEQALEEDQENEDNEPIDPMAIDAMNKCLRLLREKLNELDREYEKWGYEYFYPEDEEIIEDCDANDWEFDADGNLW